VSALELAQLTAAEVRAGGYDKAVLPVGATEYHGDHLPYSADTITAETLARRFATDLGGMLVLPAPSYGVSSHHLSFPWTLSVRPETLAAIVEDIGASLLRHGITKLLIVTAHDGNPAPVEIACRNLHAQQGLHFARFSVWQGRSCELLAGQGRPSDLDRAAGSEVSMVLHAAPQLAYPKRSPARPSEPPGGPLRLFGDYADIAPERYTGALAEGSAEEGAAIVDALAAHVVPYLRRLDEHGWRPGPWM